MVVRSLKDIIFYFSKELKANLIDRSKDSGGKWWYCKIRSGDFKTIQNFIN